MLKLYANTDSIENLLEILKQLGDGIDEAIRETLIVGSDFMIDGLKRGAEEYGHGEGGKSGRSTGGMVESIQRKEEPKMNDWGGEVTVTFKGADKHGERYGAIAAYLNYGTTSISADHWVDNTMELISPLVTDVMKQNLERKLKKKAT